MAIPLYLAMTAAEFKSCSDLPDKIGWMACHFSPYGTGLSNLPRKLPKDSLLIVNDRTPICGHDPDLIFEQLSDIIREQSPAGVFLDFQRPGIAETQDLARHLLTLPCPVAVSQPYAQGLDCPVFLPPVPVNQPLSDYLAPWIGREIWLDAAPGSMTIRLDDHGSVTDDLSIGKETSFPFSDHALHCRYRIDADDISACFHLYRAEDDLMQLLEDGKQYGVTAAVGLYQELK